MITYINAFLELPQLSEDENQASNTFLNYATLIYFRKTISHSLKKLLADNILLAAASVEDTPEEFVKTSVAEVWFSPVLRQFSRTLNRTSGPVRVTERTLNRTLSNARFKIGRAHV